MVNLVYTLSNSQLLKEALEKVSVGCKWQKVNGNKQYFKYLIQA